ncbi:MAG: hypothetical protein WAV54_10725 [Acidimicrobiales bacterium]
MTTLTRVLRPFVVPGIATTVLYAFLFSWTEFLGALTFTTNDWIYTLPVALVNIESSDAYGQINFGVLIAGAVIAMIPASSSTSRSSVSTCEASSPVPSRAEVPRMRTVDGAQRRATPSDPAHQRSTCGDPGPMAANDLSRRTSRARDQ